MTKYWPLAISFTLLFVGSFLDNTRGPILPVVRAQLGMSAVQQSLFLVCGHLAAVLTALSMMSLYNRWDSRHIALVALGLGTLLAPCAWLEKNPSWFYAF